MAYNVLEVCRHIINFCNEKEYSISNLKLQKILYFVQAFFLISFNGERKCFNEKIEAWDFGPVVQEAYHEFKQYGSGNIPAIKSYLDYDDVDDIWSMKRVPFKDNIITQNDKKLIDDVVEQFANYSATSLVSLTHNQAPWVNAYEPHKNNEITKESIMEYFNSER